MSARSIAPTWTSFSRPFTCPRCLLKLRRSGQRRWISRNRLAREKEADEQWAKLAEKIKGGDQQSLVSLLEERGFIQSVVGERDALDRLLTQRRVGAYVGVDPTGPSLHVGHMVAFMPLLWMYAHGYRAVTLLGGATAGIGDPTGRTTAREITTSTVRKTNMAVMHMQLKKLWMSAERYVHKRGYIREMVWRRGLVNNNLWWNKKSLLEVIKVLGSGVRIGPMLGRDNVKTRLESGGGMSFAEFTYPLMQCWDWWELYQQQGVQIQIGGSDQYGNILSGIEGIKYMNKTHPDPVIRQDESDPLYEPMGITVPLLTTPSGEKFGKSAGNAVWLAQDMTSTFELYQYFVRQPDSEVERLLKLLTFIPIPEIEHTMKEHSESPEKRLAQHTLAREFVELVHGPDAAADAEAQHRVAFSGKLPRPPDKTSSKQEQQVNAFNAPSHHVILPRSLITSQALSRVMVSAGLTKSRSESHQLMTNNGVSIGSRSDKSGMGDDLTFSPLTNWTADKNVNYVIDDSLMIFRRGKWMLKIIKIVSDEEFEKLGLVIPDWPVAAPPTSPGDSHAKVVNSQARERVERFHERNLKQRLDMVQRFKSERVVGPGMSPRDMKQRLVFKQQAAKNEAKRKRQLERWNSGIEEEEEVTEAEKEKWKKIEEQLWKDVKL